MKLPLFRNEPQIVSRNSENFTLVLFGSRKNPPQSAYAAVNLRTCGNSCVTDLWHFHMDTERHKMEQEHFVLILAWTLSMSLLCQDFIVVLSYPNIIGEKCILPSTYNVYNDMPLTTWFAQLCDCLENIRKQRPQAAFQFNPICLSKNFAIKLKCYVCSAIHENFPIRFPTKISSFDMRLFF